MGIIGKNSAKAFVIFIVILAFVAVDLIFTANHNILPEHANVSRFFEWFNFVFTAAFGIGVIKLLWDKWEDK